jgi:hypothetical protein
VDVGTRPSNSAPTANAGPNQTSSASANCTPISYGSGGYDCNDCAAAAFSLSAAGSSDADGDTISYAWAITSGAIHGTLSTTRGSTTTLTVSGVTATYGSAAVADVVVTLTATDCMGAIGTDDVTIEMQCSGY